MMKTVASAFLILASAQASAELPACASDAAAKFEIPEKVFHAMVLEARANWQGKPKHYGPMGLYDLVIPHVAGEIGVSSESIRNDPCPNYYASAWWLMNEAGGNEDSIWDAVAVYYHGRKERESYPMRDRVRAIYEQL
ncbi:hypothetical protein [Marinobacter sp. tcs-11]|uniref:hypothetical protein n=1 Tax=Marinobacter sp. tcs-11 TaxID=1742860 RepID=UPI00257CBFEB|nr:hypothetical protein [Marinobacter sp. tcs-11]